MKIKVIVSPSTQEAKRLTYTLNDLGLTQKQWNKLSDAEKRFILTESVDAEPEQPFWSIDSFEEVD